MSKFSPRAITVAGSAASLSLLLLPLLCAAGQFNGWQIQARTNALVVISADHANASITFKTTQLP